MAKVLAAGMSLTFITWIDSACGYKFVRTV